MLDQAAAAALFAIVVGNTQGQDVLAKQRPWRVEDHGDAFLVVGSPYTRRNFLRFVKCHVFFDKSNAEVLGFGCDGRQILSKTEEEDWRRKMTKTQFDAVFGEAFEWDRDGVRDAIRALYGGVVNTPADAVAYAKVLLQTTPRGTMLAQTVLTAVERGDVWHIIREPDKLEVMMLSRKTGERLSPLPR